jgi:ABC-type lipopolysaccharide export system ATPase subunit
LASGVISRLCQVMQELASSGVGVVVTDQNLGQWESVIDRAVPLLRGRTMSAIHTQTELMAVLGHKTA